MTEKRKDLKTESMNARPLGGRGERIAVDHSVALTVGITLETEQVAFLKSQGLLWEAGTPDLTKAFFENNREDHGPDYLLVPSREHIEGSIPNQFISFTENRIYEGFKLPFKTTFAPGRDVGRFRCFIAGKTIEFTAHNITPENWQNIAADLSKRNADAGLSVPEPKVGTIPLRAEYFKTPGRLLDTPRHATAQGDFPAIRNWYLQTAFNRTVGMAAAALTRTDSREDILGIQKATVEEIEDLVFWREDGTPAHGQHREDILRAFEALRAIPVPIVKIDWKQIGTDRNPRFTKDYKLGVGQLVQTYWPIWRNRATGEIAHAADPVRKKDLVQGKQDRRKKTRELVEANPVAALLKAFPPDKYEVAGIEWRWNTDIAEDFICPQVALTQSGRPRQMLTKGRHIEGSRFVMVNRRYFAVQKHLRAARMTYAPRLLDLIISEKTHITSRIKGAIWLEIEAEKVVKWLDLWAEYQNRSKHVLEDHIQEAILALVAEGVMLPGTWPLPRTPTNKDRRKSDFYRWKVAELWSTVALVTPEEANEIQAELIGITVKPQSPPDKAVQVALPGLEPPPAPTVPSGADIRAARETAGVNLRDFARMMKGPEFSTWSRYESGKSIRVGSIKPDIWKRVRDFIEKNRKDT